MKLPDELLDNFKYDITEEDIQMLEEVFKAGMLEAADIAEAEVKIPVSSLSDDNDWNDCCEEVAKAIRGAANEASMKKLGVLARSWLNEQSEDAFRAGMLESADIVDGYSDTLGGKPLHDIAGEISSAIREAAELGAWAELLDALRCAKNSR